MISSARTSKLARSFQGGRYLVHSLLGSGATGSVYEVSDRELDGVRVALKVLHAHLVDDEIILNRFRSQVLLARQLSHPNIVQVFDFDSDAEGNHFVTMELVNGRSLQSFLRENNNRSLPFSEALELLLDVAQALSSAHSRGIIHRDLKPSNLLLSYEGEVKLSDFGLARGLESSLGLTQTGELVGTPAYMAPEQFSNDAVDERSDIYAFGILAYQLTHGSLPFGDLPYLAQANAHLSKAFPSSEKTVQESLPLWFEEFVAKCCEKKPEDRYVSASALVTMLREHIPEKAENTESSYRFSFLKKSPQRNLQRRLRLAMSVLSSLLLLILFVTARQTSTRRYLGSSLLRVESTLGIPLTPLKALLGIHVSLNEPKEFLELVANGDPSRASIQAYLRAGGRTDLSDETGNGLMHLALGNVETHILYELQAAGVNINQQNAKGETALLRAIRLQYPVHVSELLVDGANPNFCDYSFNCPIHYARKMHDQILLNQLLSHGAIVTLPNAEGRNVLHESARDLDIEELSQFVLRNHAGVSVLNSRDKEGLTPLMYLAQSQGEKKQISMLIEFLLTNGERLQARDDLGRTALLHALLNKNENAARRLLEMHADPLDQDALGKTAAEYAREAGLEALSPVWSRP